MSGQRTVLITGGTSGLGRQTAKIIAEAGDDWVVVITGRAGAAIDNVAADIGNRVHGLPLDLGSLANVRRFVAEFPTHLPPLHAIVCNAGIQVVSGTTVTQDGLEQTFAVNHLAHFLLVRELLPQLKSPGRIVFVASDTHDPARRTPIPMPAPVYGDARSLAYPPSDGKDDIDSVGRCRYTTSKLCNVMTAYEFARRLDKSGITANAFDPGLMPGTGLARDYGRMQVFAWRFVLPLLTVVPGTNVHTPRQSASALARLVLAPELAEVNGKYFSGRRETKSSEDSYDRMKSAELWDTSLDLLAEKFCETSNLALTRRGGISDNRGVTKKDSNRATSSLEFVSQEFVPYHTDEQGHDLLQGQVVEKYTGADFNGDGTIQSLLAMGKKGSGNFGNLIHITGSIGGRTGTFVVQGRGWLKGVDPATGVWSSAGAEWFIVSGSGTGELVGLHGEGEMSDSGNGAKVTVNYWFE